MPHQDEVTEHIVSNKTKGKQKLKTKHMKNSLFQEGVPWLADWQVHWASATPSLHPDTAPP